MPAPALPVGPKIRPGRSPQLTAEQRRYLEWKTAPTADRTPRTQAAYADLHNISLDELRAWEALPRFRSEQQKALSHYLSDPAKLQRVAEVLFDQIDQRDPPPAAVKSFFDLSERVNPLTKVIEETERLADLDGPRLLEALTDVAALHEWTVTVTDKHGNPVQ